MNISFLTGMVYYSSRKALLYSTLGVLCTFPAAFSPVWAEDALPAETKPEPAGPAYFYPSAAWEVKPLQDKDSGLKICAIATQFNNGFFIQMSAAQEGINSISINFRQPVFAEGTTANVGIAAPGVLKKLLPAVAFKPELLAINFKGQSDLFDAIKTAGVMDFSMGAENQFRFYLNGFALALPRLAKCMQSHASAGVSVDIPVPGMPAPAMAVAPVAPAVVPQAPVAAPIQSAPVPEPAQPAVQASAPSPIYSTDAPDERAPKGPPNPVPAASAFAEPNPLDPAGKDGGDTVLRTTILEQEAGRAPPPPPRRLKEIEAPPVYTNTEPVINAPSPEAIAKSKEALDQYQQEMMRVMPPEEPGSLSAKLKAPKTPALQVTTLPETQDQAAPVRPVPALEVITPEGDVAASGVLDPGPRRERIGKKRLSDMLVEDMAKQYQDMSGEEGRLRPDIKEKLDEQNGQADQNVQPPPEEELQSTGKSYQLKPLVAPLIKRGTAEEKALVDILSQPAPASNAPPTPVLPQSAPGVAAPAPSAQRSQSAPPSAAQNSVTLRGDQVVPKQPSPAASEARITRQTKTIEADLTEIGKPPEPESVLPRSKKSWLDILREKQEQENSAIDPASQDEPAGVYIPDGSAVESGASPQAMPAFSAPAPGDAVEIGKVPALSPRAKTPRLTASTPETFSPQPSLSPVLKTEVHASPSSIEPEMQVPEQVETPLPVIRQARQRAKSDSRPVLYATPREAAEAQAGEQGNSDRPGQALPVSAGAGTVSEKKIQILEQQLAAVVKENVELEAELASALDQGKHEAAAIESRNWNLEQSTGQYEEAKKQIDRLGAQIQKERAQCTAEKKDLEAMLFDPQVTQQQQLARLAELEDAVNDANRKLEEQRQVYEGRIRLLQDQIGAAGKAQ